MRKLQLGWEFHTPSSMTMTQNGLVLNIDSNEKLEELFDFIVNEVVFALNQSRKRYEFANDPVKEP